MTTFSQSLPEPSFIKIEESDRILIFAFGFLFTVFYPCLHLDVESEAMNSAFDLKRISIKATFMVSCIQISFCPYKCLLSGSRVALY